MYSRTIIFAATWIEDFNGENLDSWKEYDEHFGEGMWAPETVWKTKNGMMDVWIDPPPSPSIFEIFPLEFIGFPIEAKNLMSKLRCLRKKMINSTILVF